MIVTSERKKVPPAPWTLPAAAKMKLLLAESRLMTLRRAPPSDFGIRRTISPRVRPVAVRRRGVSATAEDVARTRVAARQAPRESLMETSMTSPRRRAGAWGTEFRVSGMVADGPGMDAGSGRDVC